MWLLRFLALAAVAAYDQPIRLSVKIDYSSLDGPGQHLLGGECQCSSSPVAAVAVCCCSLPEQFLARTLLRMITPRHLLFLYNMRRLAQPFRPSPARPSPPPPQANSTAT
jgi:hypothetical protein